jgi:deoxycytidine triphosphate deaminase
MFESGRYVADALGGVDDEQVQPNGVDLRLGAVFEQVEPGRIGTDGKTVGDRREIEPTVEATGERSAADGDATAGGGTDGETNAEDGIDGETNAEDGTSVYHLDPGGYVVRYADTVRIPEDHVGFLYPRSSLLRNSCMLDTAVWDAGYEGVGEGLLEVYHPVELERGARIAQLVLAAAAHADTYDGDYHLEHLD